MYKDNDLVTVTVTMLANVLTIKLDFLELDQVMFSLHSLHCGGATAAYR